MLPKQSDETKPSDWFELALDRLRAADILWNSEGLSATGIEVLHEAAERFCKGYLIALGWRLIKTHDLQLLIIEMQKKNARFMPFQKFAAELTTDFFAQHYPGGDWSRIGENYAELRAQLSQIIDIIKSEIPNDFPTK
jgi:HEPN domain-containing protein